MALNFPDSPTLNQVYTDTTSGFSYQWNGSVWISYSPSSSSQIKVLDDISSSFNGSTQTFPLTINGTALTPASAQQLIVNLGGVIQDPSDDYSISTSNIVFSTPPASGLTFSGVSLGPAVPIDYANNGNVYYRQTYSVTGVQTTFTFTSGYTVGYLDVYHNGVRLSSGTDFTATNGSTFDLTVAAQDSHTVEAIGYRVSQVVTTQGNFDNLVVTGVSTLGNTIVGGGTTQLVVNGDARITGILTIGTSSITLNGSTNRINVGTGLTLSSSGILAGIITASNFVGNVTGNLTGTASTATASATAYGLTGSPNITVGVITATSFIGDGSGLTGVGPSQQAVTSQAGITTINLSLGNVIYFTHDTDTTVAFANTSTTQEVTFIRQKDNTDTARNITWPSNIKWNIFAGNSNLTPTLINTGRGNSVQTFSLITRNGGSTWYGWEESSYPGDSVFLYGFGTNNNGQLGQNNVTSVSTPRQVPGTTWSSVDAGGDHTLATKTDGTLWAWGFNTQGALGLNNTIQYSSPVQVPGTTWNSVSAGYRRSLARKTDGTLWAWGANNRGQLGQNNNTYYSSPVQIPGTTWNSFVFGNRHTLATKTDGTLWTWGENSGGQLGQNNTTAYFSPVQIPGTTWNSISAGYQSLATKTDGTLWSWGYNQTGMLGLNLAETSARSSPIQIPGTTWSSVSCGSQFSLATKNDGTLWAWGSNSGGRLGLNNLTQFSSPVQIPGNTWRSPIRCELATTSGATKTDGTLWMWGNNANGKVGQNNQIEYSSPIQIPGNTWSSVGVFEHTMGLG